LSFPRQFRPLCGILFFAKLGQLTDRSVGSPRRRAAGRPQEEIAVADA
jgi:hypothetical protein